jgi:uncharacterized membrane protein YraQ (UPF0718 family)
MNLKNFMMKNKLVSFVATTYLFLLVFLPEYAIKSFDNSIYYLIEMFEVLPVIFLLTVAIEVLVPKEVIIKHFGENSGFKGNILSLVLGSISAGPIYAAFPVARTLLSKGASITSISIILSSWAVIKVPMLANEAKFLGVNFMIFRWIYTVIVILGMSYIIGKLVKKEDMQIKSAKGKVVEIEESYCIGCGICARILPTVFVMKDAKAKVIHDSVNITNHKDIEETALKCPVKAINFMGEKSA